MNGTFVIPETPNPHSPDYKIGYHDGGTGKPMVSREYQYVQGWTAGRATWRDAR